MIHCQIVLSIYNGEDYLKEQLDSLFQQTNQQWTLLVRDDGSTDGSAQIIEQYAKKYPNRITWLKDNAGNVGTILSTLNLLKNSTADYVFTCDQDDYWLTDKVQRSLEAIQKAEPQFGQHTPLLVHTNLKFGDAQLNITHSSYFGKNKINPEQLKTLPKNLLASYFMGATMLLNRALIGKLQPPIKALKGTRNYQDWWLSLQALNCGKIITVQQPTMVYRLHNLNDSARKLKTTHQNTNLFWRVMIWGLPKNISNRIAIGYATTLASVEIIQSFAEILPKDSLNYQICKTYLEVRQKSFFARKWGFIKHGYRRQTFIHSLFVFCWF